MRRTALVLLASSALALPLLPSADAASKSPAWTKYPKPAVTGKWLADRDVAFSTDYTGRVTGTVIQWAARDELVAELKGLGYTVAVETYNGAIEAITAVKKGTKKPDETIMFGGHFDALPQSVAATYDNGSGTTMVLGLARAFANVKTQRTLQFNLYNGEEEGAFASDAQAKAYKAAGRKVTAYLGFDMVGIAWPVGVATTKDYCLCMWRGTKDPDFDQLLAEVNYGFLKYPNDKQKVSIEGRNVRNSDEASWADAGYRTLRWAGMRTAAAYPQYHMPEDNPATIDKVAGGRQYFEQGLRNTLLSAYYTAAAIDTGR